jgi:glycosyltransferase involved in cell wall biosynthesis
VTRRGTLNIKPKVCILTSSHKANDERIFYKQAKSIAGAGYDTVVVAAHPADEALDGIRIKAVPKARTNIGRLFVTPLHILAAGIREKADVYHFHDPELLPAGLVLRLLGRKVIYDAHEYYKMKVLSKDRVPAWLRNPAAYVFDILETLAARTFSGVIVTDRVTEGKFKGMAIVVSNPPYKSNASRQPKEKDGAFKCVYIGGLERDRGLFKMVEAMEHVDGRVRLVLAGRISDGDLNEIKRLKGYSRVDYMGLIPWAKVLELLPDCDLGLLLLQPVPGYFYHGENSIKLFEYMMAGMPVLGSNFVNLERIIKEAGCGSTVDPTDPREIAKQIMYFADNPEVCRTMGENGIRAVLEKYNWENEAEKLLALYGGILDTGAHRRHSYA